MEDNNNELLESLIRLEWLLRYRHMQTHRERGPMGDPHRGQGRILALLKLQPEIGQKELGSILDIRSQSLGELLAKLERQGYITRSSSSADRRAMDIRLTEAGKTAADQGDESPDSDLLFGCLTEDEQTSLGGMLERLIKDWEERLRADGAEPDFAAGPGGRRGGFGRMRGFPGAGMPGDADDDSMPPFGRHGFGGHGFRGRGRPSEE